MLDALLDFETGIHININIAAVMGTDNPVGLAFAQELNGKITHLGGVDAVAASGNTATLNVARASAFGQALFQQILPFLSGLLIFFGTNKE